MSPDRNAHVLTETDIRSDSLCELVQIVCSSLKKANMVHFTTLLSVVGVLNSLQENRVDGNALATRNW